MQPEIASPKKRFIESSSFYRNCELNDPFSSMRIDDSQFLDNLPTRGICSVCNRSRKYYCYTCYVPVKEISDRLPKINLPIKIDIIKHPKEVDGKSTSAHAAVLAPDDVKIYNYPDFPSYDNEKVLLIFPGKSAVPFQEWWNKAIHSQESSDRPKCIIFIDSTWRQSKAMYNDSRLQSLPCVILSEYKSVFWRHQKGKPDTYLATIEAIYYFLRELDNLMNPGVHYSGKYDNLLFLFKYFYMKLRCIYDISSAEK
ncbi:DTW domain-containing protein 1 [Argiope bruennichi]|uniref:tRNA-uridine aminocarboxypropyltransferase 1 n=1 Tax=Argiope bruennichi TaxID=94029 RepID=A0A8T0G1D8_ARGBR|nr:DTW domain-containing protein 1 [Argiope bruennichi]